MSKNRKGKPDYRNRNTRRARPQSNRAQEHRANESRTNVRPTIRKPGTLLDLPTPPKGIIFYWLAREVFGEKAEMYDHRIQEGWKPIDPSAIPNSHLWPQHKVGSYGNCITIRGMVACQMSEAQYAANEAVYEELAKHEQLVIRQKNMQGMTHGGHNDLARMDHVSRQDYINSIPDEF